jgi:hypothetical protein
MDALSAHVCVLDEAGRIVAVNRAWRAFAAANPPVRGDFAEGANYLAVCDAAIGSDAAEAVAFASGIRAVMRGERDEFAREYVEDWSERTQVPVDCEFHGLGGPRLPVPVEATLYRVAQEALANVERHAQARRVSVLLECDGARARLTVEDNGIGFDGDAVPRSPDAAQGLGLLGRKERVALVGGTLLIESSAGAGTTILARIPLSDGARLSGAPNEVRAASTTGARGGHALRTKSRP